MSDTRTVTREQLAAALLVTYPLNGGAVDALWAALPAAAPAGEPETAPRPDCKHQFITTFGIVTEDGGIGEITMWACQECQRRFYPACPVCIVNGHRNGVHEAEASVTAPSGLDVERLHKMIGFDGEGVGLWTHDADPDGVGRQRENFYTFRVDEVHECIDRWYERLRAERQPAGER